jgi:HK97 family phage prohead protease
VAVVKLNAKSSERKESTDSSGRLEQKRVGKPFVVAPTGAEGSFEGYGAVFNVLHDTSSWMLGPEWQDRILPGAFTVSLAEHKKNGTRPLMFTMHERGNVPGAWRDVHEDKDGLFCAGEVSPRAISDSGVPLYELMKMGAINGLSIGFCVTKCQLDEELMVRDIIEVELAEVSIVDIPGGPTARITDVKSRDPRNIQFLETVLRDAGLSRKEAKAVLAEGFTALRDAAANDEPPQRDAGKPDGSTKNSESIADVIRSFTKSIRPTGQE